MIIFPEIQQVAAGNGKKVSLKQYDVSHCIENKSSVGLPNVCVHVTTRTHTHTQSAAVGWWLFERRDEKAFCDWGGVSAIDQ